MLGKLNHATLSIGASYQIRVKYPLFEKAGGAGGAGEAGGAGLSRVGFLDFGLRRAGGAGEAGGEKAYFFVSAIVLTHPFVKNLTL
ncbi:MAG: hypothetical protein AB4426_11315 [Xenococcaceae cyanobacterium]